MTSRHESSRRANAPQASSPITKPSPSSLTPPDIRRGMQGGGQALDKHTNAAMSAQFGHDFSQVRIHTDSHAGESTRALGANAYALGGDIVFGAGKYQPGSRETDRLLAHELTHVVQQSQSEPGDWGRTSGKGDASEREADSLASEVMVGRSVDVQAAPGAADGSVTTKDAGVSDPGDRETVFRKSSRPNESSENTVARRRICLPPADRRHRKENSCHFGNWRPELRSWPPPCWAIWLPPAVRRRRGR